MDFNYATMGSSLIPMNPLVGGIATAAGLGVDLLMNRQNQMSQLQVTKDYNKKMMEDQTSIYEQPGGYKQVMPGLKKGGTVKSQKGIAFRNRKPAGHIIPADKVLEAQADARTAGVSLKRIPGQSSPTADDRMLQLPGAQPVRVSSGEALVSDDEFSDMARMAGMDRTGYQMKMYPNSRDLRVNDGPDKEPDGDPDDVESKASGGTIDWNPPMVNPPGSSGYQPMGFGPQMAILNQFGQGQTPGLPTMASAPRIPGINGMGPMAVPGTLPPAPAPAAPSIGYGDGETNEPPPIQAQGGGTDPAKQPGAFDPNAETAMIPGITPGTQSITQAGMDDGTLEKSFEDMRTMNDRAAYGQAVPALLSMGHNLFSRRVAGRPPMAYQPMMLDMHTEAMSAGLDAGRQRSVATAAQNSRGEQSQSRNLGIGANDQAARTSNNMAVEGVKNQERQINTQISNQAAQFNAQRNDQFEAGEAAGTNDWKLRKGQAITNDLAALSGIVGGHAQGNVEIGAMKQMFGFQKRLYDTMSGAPSSQYATSSYVFTGDKKDMAQPEQTADNLMDPAQLQAMLSGFFMGSPKWYRPGFGSLTPWRR